jgi:hypothetical protein
MCDVMQDSSIGLIDGVSRSFATMLLTLTVNTHSAQNNFPYAHGFNRATRCEDGSG